MYKRVLLKLSGEALSSEESPFEPKVLQPLALELKKVIEQGTQVAIVVGGGNIIRGKFASVLGLPRVQADKMGMLGTLLNALALQGACDQLGIKSVVQCAVECPRVCELIDARKAVQYLEEGTIVIFAGGTGNPYFSTDSGAALRAAETNCEVILLAKNGVDGVYTADPRKDPTAVKYDELTYDEMLEKNLQVIDTTAASMCRDTHIGAIVFNMNQLENISAVCAGEKLGTVIKAD